MISLFFPAGQNISVLGENRAECIQCLTKYVIDAAVLLVEQFVQILIELNHLFVPLYISV
ncbi:hypothetical protein D3C73_1576850 [compost metagenome]